MGLKKKGDEGSGKTKVIENRGQDVLDDKKNLFSTKILKTHKNLNAGQSVNVYLLSPILTKRKIKISRYFMKMNRIFPINYLEHKLKLSKYTGLIIDTRGSIVRYHA